MDLVLLGANLDTDDEAKLGQLKELQVLLCGALFMFALLASASTREHKYGSLLLPGM